MASETHCLLPVTQPLKSSPVQPLLSEINFTKSQDECFNCRKRGHWSKNCPDKENKKLRSSDQSKSLLLSIMNVPVIRCPCGNGACSVYPVNKSKKNFGRKFYTCCQRKENKCGYFRWFDEVLKFKVPPCPCGAGACSLNLHENGRWFLACRIKKGHGACQFSQWADDRITIRMNMHFHDKISCACPWCFKTPQFIGTSRCEEDEESFWDLVIQETESLNQVLSISPSQEDEMPNRDSNMLVTESSNHLVCSTLHPVEDKLPNLHSIEDDELPNKDIIMGETNSSNNQVLSTSLSEEDGVPNRHLVMSEPKSSDHPNLQEVCYVSYTVCQSANRRKSISCMQISAEGDILNQATDGIRQNIGLQVSSWLDRLSFSSSQCIKDQPVSPFYRYDATLSGVEGSAIVPNGLENSQVIVQQPATPIKDAQLSSGVSRCHTRCQNCNTRRNDSTSLSVFKNIGQGLLKSLEGKNLVDRQEMCKIADSFFEAFRQLSINHSSFSEHVMKYIDYKSRLAAVEVSMCEVLSSQEHEGIFNCEEAEYGESSHVKKRRLFRNLEQELEQADDKTSELKTSQFKINPEMSVTLKSMEASQEEMEEAFAYESERKFLQEEARTALEKARAELPS